MYWQKEIDRIAQWMKNYAEKAGDKGYTIGLSGGIDSAVVVCLAVKAIGWIDIQAITMPYQDQNTDLVKKLCDNLNIGYQEIKIDDICNSFFKSIDLIPEKIYDCDAIKSRLKIQVGNIKARTRMIILYDCAKDCNCLVAGTGNKSELYIGYNTKFGDGGVDIEPIGNYYKTEIYEIAKLMPEIPKEIITRPPSAELWDGQTDEEELEITYKELDKILKYLNIRNIYSVCDGEDQDFCQKYFNNLAKNISQEDIELEKVKKVINLIISAQHKNQLPPRYPRS